MAVSIEGTHGRDAACCLFAAEPVLGHWPACLGSPPETQSTVADVSTGGRIQQSRNCFKARVQGLSYRHD